MNKNNILLELLNLLKKVYKNDELISLLIDNGFTSDDLYDLGFIGYDIDLGIAYNFNQPEENNINDKLKAIKISITYYGVGNDLKEAKGDAWNDISNDRNFQRAYIEEDECNLEETNFDSSYLQDLVETK